MRTYAAIAGVVMSLLVARDADAQSAIVRDGGDFTIDLGPVGACIVEPRELRRQELCVGMTPDAAHVPETTSERRVVALGVFHPRAGGVGVIGVYKITARSSEPHTQADAVRLMEQATTGVQNTVPSGAHARSSSTRIVLAQNGVKVVRGDIDVDGLPASQSALQHIAMAMINTTTGSYAVSVSAPSAARAETNAALDAILPGAFVRQPAKGTNLASALGYAIGAGFVIVVMIVVLVIALAMSSRRPPPPPFGAPPR